MQISLMSVYLWTLSFIRPYLWTFIFLILCGTAVTSVELAIPKMIQIMIDDVFPEKQAQLFYVLMACLVGILFVFIGALAAENMLQRMLQEKAAKDLQYSIYQKLRTLGFSYFERHPVGESLSLMNSEVTSVQSLYRQFLPWTVKGFIFAIISVAMMLHLNWELTLVSLPCLLLYYLVGPYFEKKASVLGEQFANERVRLNQKIYESISSLPELRANRSEKWDLSLFLDQQNLFNKKMIDTHWYAFWRGGVRRLSYYAGGIVMIVYGFNLVKLDELSVGAFVAFLLYFFNAMHRITSLVTSITEQRVLMYQAKKLYEFMQIEPDVSEPDLPQPLHQAKGKIEFIDVHFSYPSGPPVLQNFDLHIQPGERMALVGKSGEGKSSALKLVGRFYDPQQGEIRIDGIPIHQLSFEQLRQHIGFVFQETYLFGASVRENILFGKPDASEEEMIKAAKAAYAHDFIMDLPQGYDTPLGERGVRLSGGQKQRIAIARMFIMNPAIVLLDEATSALDQISEFEVQKAFENFLQGRTTLTVAHRLSTIQDYDYIAVMDQGQIVEGGPYKPLVEQRGLFYQMLRGEEAEKEERYG